jgi:thiol-disulfide isomerase/thioredoxin
MPMISLSTSTTSWSRPAAALARAALVVTSLALAATGCNGEADDASDADLNLVGKPAPEIEAEAVGGDGPSSVGEAKGQVTIVDFWATFCDPCRKSFPKYQELVDKHAGKLVVIGVSVDDPDDVGTDEIKAWTDELQVSFPIVWDKDKKTANAYKPPKMPTSYVLDKKGIVRHVHAGYTADEADEIAKEVDALLAE